MDKIICVGKNYLDHAEEMQEAIPELPLLFLKPPSVLKTASQWDETVLLQLPNQHDEFHYECELVFKVKADGSSLKELKFEEAFSHVSIGLDMTNRTLQAQAKKAGAPWTTGKVFQDAAVIGPWLKISDFDIKNLAFSFVLNDQIKQNGNSHEMRMDPLELLTYASEFFPVCAGDLLFTGTPKGVGPIKGGDKGRIILNQQYQYAVSWT